MQALCRDDQLSLGLLQSHCCVLGRGWCAGCRDGALSAGVRHEAQLDTCVFPGLAADLCQLPGLEALAFDVDPFGDFVPKGPVDNVGLDLHVGQRIAKHVRLVALGWVGIHVELLADVPHGPRLAAGIGTKFDAELCSCVVERGPEFLRRRLNRNLILASQGLGVPLTTGVQGASSRVDVAVVQLGRVRLNRQRLRGLWLQLPLDFDTGPFPQGLTTQALVHLGREGWLAGHHPWCRSSRTWDTRGRGGGRGWCRGRVLHGGIGLADVDRALDDVGKRPLGGTCHGTNATEASAQATAQRHRPHQVVNGLLDAGLLNRVVRVSQQAPGHDTLERGAFDRLGQAVAQCLVGGLGGVIGGDGAWDGTGDSFFRKDAGNALGATSSF